MALLATVAAFGFPDFNPPTLLPIYQRLGCRTCQFYRNTHNPPKPADARKLVEDLGIPFDSIHGVFDPEHDPSCPDDKIRQAAIETYRKEGELALQLGGPRVVVHPSSPAPEGTEITTGQRAARISPFRRTLEELARIGEKLGVVYLLENIPPNYWFGSDPVQIGGMVRAMSHPNIRMCFDTGHAHMVGKADELLDKCRDVVSYFHVHDNDAVKDSHQIPGKGSLAWEPLGDRMAKMRDDLPAMLELFESEATLKGQVSNGLPGKLQKWLALKS
jgi:sugar phosphate isomerase/epimerase